MTKKPRPWNPPRPTIKGLQDWIAGLERNVTSHINRNQQLEAELKQAQEKLELLTRDKSWLKQLCQEQSASIAGYMRSR